MLELSWFPKSKKKNQTEVQNASIFLIGFGTDFCAIRVPSWGHVGLLLAHKTHPRSTNKASKIGPNTQDGPRRVPDPSRTPPNIDFGAPWTSIFHGFWIVFCLFFDIDLFIILQSFSIHLKLFFL